MAQIECKNSNCEGEKVSSNCLVWEGKKFDYSSFNAMVEYLMETAKTYLEKPVVDLKTLSDKNLNRDEILQLFVDKFLQIGAAANPGSGSALDSCNLDISSINTCSTCSQTMCEKLQVMVNVLAQQQAEINQLKQTLYN